MLTNIVNELAMALDTSKFTSRDDIAYLIPAGGIGVELGVAEGKFSEKLLEKSKLGLLCSIDRYSGERGHDDEQFEHATIRLSKFGPRSQIIRADFKTAVNLFPDSRFDFIYIDGYAHTGQEEGRTLADWFPKLRPGGIFSGDDYSEKWPKVVEQVNKFVAANGLELHVIKDWNGHHSWLTYKK